MKQPRKIDTSLKERHKVLRLLERLKQETVTVDEMEEIGTKLQKSGDRALSPLVRKLWRERSSDLISRYAYLLDFFDEEEWMSQLVQIAIQRRDLDGDGKAVLLAALKGYGVDISAPPFARLLEEAGDPVGAMFNRIFDMGDEGLVVFMEDFLCHGLDVQRNIIAELASMADPRVLEIFRILLWFDDEDVVRQTVTTLGRVRTPEAALLLADFCINADGDLRELVERSLRRLSFLGIAPPEEHQGGSFPFHGAYVSPFDASGNRSLWISRWRSEKLVSSLYLQLHDREGIKGAWGCSAATEKEIGKHLREVCSEEGLVQVPVEYALLLLRDAIARSDRADVPLPAEFHVLRPHLFPGIDISSMLHEVDAMGSSLVRNIARNTESLLDDDFFAGWFVTTPRVYDFAEEVDSCREGDRIGIPKDVLVRFCKEILSPDLDLIRQRLLLTAELIDRSGRDSDLADLTRAAAETLPKPMHPCHQHPFVRRFARESIEIAREALAEGFDLRTQLADTEETD